MRSHSGCPRPDCGPAARLGATERLIPGGTFCLTSGPPGSVGRLCDRGSSRRWGARRSHVAGRGAARRFRAGRAVRRATRLRAHRSTDSLRRRGDLRRGRLLRPRSVAHRHDRHAARRRAGRDGLVPDDLRHLPRSAERVRVRHQRGGRSVRRASARPGRSGFELGWQLGRQDAHDRNRMERRVPHSAAHVALRAGPADVGCQLLPEHSAHTGADVLGAAAARIQPGPAVVGRRAARP